MRLVPAALALALVALAGCSSPELSGAPAGLDPARVRTVHGHGFVVIDDGALEPQESAALFAELAEARPRILGFLKHSAAPGDFRSWEERHQAACAPGEPTTAPGAAPAAGATPGEIRIVVQRDGGRCHADETGITLLKAHISRRDATHELVHYLAGAGWRPADEGLAVYVTELLWGPAWGVPVDVRARVYMDLNLDEGLERDRLEGDMNRRDYDSAGSFVKFLIENFGWDRFLEAYRGSPGNYHTVYGISEHDLFAQWREKIKGMNVRQSSAFYRFRDYLTNLKSK